MRHPRSILTTLALTATLGCSDSTGPTGPITELPRTLTEFEAELIDASNRFGLELFAEVLERDDRPNVVLSPLSASMALGMTLNGAAGETFEDMRSTLGYPGMEIDDVNTSYRSLIDLLRGLDQNVQFSVANSIWAKEEFPFEDAFFARVTDAFDARIENRDFGDPSTVDAINDWVNDATSGKIESLYEVISPDLVMLLVNAIYFDGSWTTQFDPDDTRPSDFQLDDGSFVEVDMMSLDETTVSLGGDGVVGVGELTYGRGAYGMVILVPYGQTTAREVAAELGGDRWDALLATLDEVDGARVRLPRFTISYDVLMNPMLDSMGMGIAFSDAADFSNLSPLGENLCIDHVLQKTFIKVDEAGTEAAAVTSVGIGPESGPPGLIVNRPFIFAIRERLSGTILFLGLIGDPSQDEMPEDDTESLGCR